jgi:melibiose permease
MLLIPALRRKIPKLRLFAVGILVQIIGFLILLGFSFTGLYQATSWAILCLPGMMVYAGYGVLNVMLTVFHSDSVDYGQLKNGTLEEAVTFSMQTFTVKLASGIAVFFSCLVVDMLHLSSEASASDIAATSADTLSKLRLVMTVPPIIILIAAFIIFKRFYKVDNFKQGFGLGLTLCLKTALLLGGNLSLDKDYTDGARFIFTLPTA